ncbi:hypothetical protein [Lacinutrix undariae]
MQQFYLIKTLEELKWTKYSIWTMKNNASLRRDPDACFNQCMKVL